MQWLTRLPVTQKIAGSIPVETAICGSVAQSVEQRTENPCVDGSIPFGATIFILFVSNALVAQLDRVFGYEPKGQGFESLRAHHFLINRDVAQFGRALGLGPRGCRFKSCHLDQLEFEETVCFFFFDFMLKFF